MKRLSLVFLLAAVLVSSVFAQQRGGGGRLSVGIAEVPLPASPAIFDTAEQHTIRVVVVARELSHPWGMAWLPNGDLLITERPGRLRVLRNGVLDPAPISSLPPTLKHVATCARAKVHARMSAAGCHSGGMSRMTSAQSKATEPSGNSVRSAKYRPRSDERYGLRPVTFKPSRDCTICLICAMV